MITESQFIDAVAEGQLMTETGTEALLDNQMIYVGEDPGLAELAGTRLVSLGDGRFQVVTDSAYIETLEQALKGLRDAYELEVGSEQCSLCGEWVNDEGHAPDCIVPALIAKYPDA